jgi:hypothetical protein
VRAAWILFLVGCAGAPPPGETVAPPPDERAFAGSPLEALAEDVVRVVESVSSGDRPSLVRLESPAGVEVSWEVPREPLALVAVLVRADVRFDDAWWRITLMARGPSVFLTGAFPLASRTASDDDDLPELAGALGRLEPAPPDDVTPVAPVEASELPRDRAPDASVLVALAALCTTPSREPRLLELAIVRDEGRLALETPAGRVIALQSQPKSGQRMRSAITITIADTTSTKKPTLIIVH